jgi:hypothetical protein
MQGGHTCLILSVCRSTLGMLPVFFWSGFFEVACKQKPLAVCVRVCMCVVRAELNENDLDSSSTKFITRAKHMDGHTSDGEYPLLNFIQHCTFEKNNAYGQTMPACKRGPHAKLKTRSLTKRGMAHIPRQGPGEQNGFRGVFDKANKTLVAWYAPFHHPPAPPPVCVEASVTTRKQGKQALCRLLGFLQRGDTPNGKTKSSNPTPKRRPSFHSQPQDQRIWRSPNEAVLGKKIKDI